MSVDDVSIREHVDLGDGPEEGVATQAMVILVTNVFGSWKMPLYYFLISDSFSWARKADIVSKVLERLIETNVIPTNLVCDNTSVNLTMLKILGAEFETNILNPVLNIKNIDGSHIYCYMDHPHLLKLVRNTLRKLTFLANLDV